MNREGPGPGDKPPQTAGDRVDLACDQFEAEWGAGHRPRIEDYLAEVTARERSVLLGELVALEWELRHSAGEEATPREYRDRFPGHPEVIEMAFGGLGSSDELRRRQWLTWASVHSEERSTGDSTSSRISAGETCLGVASPSLRRAPWGNDDGVPDPQAMTCVEDRAELGADPVRSLARRLTDSGLLRPIEARTALDHLAGDSGRGVEDLAAELVRRGLLTRFQARALIRGHPGRLRLGHHLLLEEIGRGGMGVVYQALDGERGGRVALKTLPRVGARELYRFKREFRSRMGLSHPNLINLFELVSDAGQWFFTMELVEGVDFLTYVRPPAESRVAGESDLAGTGSAAEGTETRRAGRALGSETNAATAEAGPGGSEAGGDGDPLRRPSAFDPTRLRSALRQLAEGINALHGAGKLHRDLKASNVLVAPGGRVVLLDFGLVADLAPHLTEAAEEIDAPGPVVLDADCWNESQSQIAGSVGYMAPEQAAGGPLTAACDWYAMGVMLFEALTSRRPFTGPALRVLRDKQLIDAPSPRDLNPESPEDLHELCRLLLSRRPEDRPRGEEVLRWLGGTSGAGAAGRGDGSPSARRVPFVGRESHLSALEEAYRTVRKGDAATVLVRGPSGVGKSTLVRRFLETLPAADRPVMLAGRCFEQESVPYKALDSLVDALGQYLRSLPGDEAAAILPGNVGALARIFPALRRVPGMAGALWLSAETPDPQVLRRRAFGALRTMLARIAARFPLVLVIDDLQWGDEDSAALLMDLIRPPDPPPLLLLACYRSEYAATSPCLLRLLGAVADSEAAGTCHELEVEAMTPGEARELALGLLGGDDTEAGPLADRIAGESGGCPYFIAELVQNVRDGTDLGVLSTSAGAVDLDAVLRARIGRLSEETRRLLEVVAVASRPLSLRDAIAAAGLAGEARRVDSALRVDNLIRGSGPRLDDEVEAYHDRIRETVIASLDLVTTRERNRQLATTLEASGRADPETLAVHFERALAPERAGECYARAADVSAQALAFDRAAFLYRRSIALRPLAGAEGRALRTRLGDALANAGRGPDAAEQYLTAAAGADRREVIDLERRAAYQYCISGHLDRGQTVLRSVLGRVGMALPGSQARGLASMVLHRLLLRARGLRFRERPAEAVAEEDLARIDVSWSVAAGLGTKNIIVAPLFQTRNLRLALRAGEPLRVVRALAWEAAYNANLGRTSWHRTQTLYDLAVEHARGRDDPYIQGMLTLAGAVLEFHQAHWKAGASLADRAGGIFRERCTGAAWELGQANTFMLWCMSWMGRFSEMAERSRLILAEAEEKGDLFTVANLGGYVDPMALVSSDRPDEAERSVLRHVPPWSLDHFHLQHLTALMSLTYIHLYRGEAQAAYEAHLVRWPAMRKNLIFHSQMTRIAMAELRGRSALALASTVADPDPLLRDAERQVQSLRRERVPHATALSVPIRAGLASLRGDQEGALNLLTLAGDAFDALDMGLFAAACRWHLGRGRCRNGDGEGTSVTTAARDWMVDQGVVDPTRMAMAFLPWLGGPRPGAGR